MPQEISIKIDILLRQRPLGKLRELAAAGQRAVYLVGGTVRELLLGRQPGDLDVAVDRGCLELAQALAASLGGTYVLLDAGERTARVVCREGELDLAEFRAADLPGDLRKRDFTCNAMAVALRLPRPGEPVELIDPYGGWEDLTAGRLEMLAPENFADDPLRLLRAFRFAATLEMTPTPATLAAVRRYLPEFGRVAGERVHQEIFKLLAAPRAAGVLRLMDEVGLLTAIFPELQEMKGVAQDGYHHLDVFDHSLATVASLEEVLAAPEVYFGDLAPLVQEYAQPGKKAALLKLAALFHDVGKPPAQERREDQDRTTFYHHERLGEEIFGRVAARLRCSQAEVKTVTHLIGVHMRPFLLLPLFQQGALTLRALGRLVKAARPELAGMFLLAMADSLAGQGPLKPADAEATLKEFCREVQKFVREKVEPLESRPRLVTGADLIRELGLTPGPGFRRLLEAVQEASLEGTVRDREEALALIRTLL